MKCNNCQKDHQASQKEIDFLKKIELPLPKLCTECRMQRRFAFRNERKLYHRKCDLTGKQIISIYPQDSKYKVYDQHEWHSDKWSASDYQRDFDFSKPFFEQFDQLMKDTPKISVFTSQNENSDFTNGAQQDKNCYMLFVSDHNEDCYFSYGIDSCTDCNDCMNCFKCTLCIECIDCADSYNLAFCTNTHNCSDSYFLSDCKSCKNCFGSFGLRNKEYYFFNEKLTKEEYEQKFKEYQLNKYENQENLKQWFYKQTKNKQVNQYYEGNSNNDVTGDHIVRCKNCINCFDSANLEDCGNLIFSFNSKDCFDGHVVVDNSELCYDIVSVINQYNTQFTYCSWYSKNSMYIDHCISCSDCFACSGLRKAKYCIFNKQYSKEEYEILKNKIIEHMKQSGEYGEYFPIELSPFPYNDTVAQEHFPITQNEAIEKGWKWIEAQEELNTYQGPESEIPEDIQETNEDVTEKIFLCETSKTPYKIIKQEFGLYQKHNLPLPHKCFNERHLERIQKRNPLKLWDRSCMKCGIELKTTFSPDKTNTIYCEKCYLETIH